MQVLHNLGQALLGFVLARHIGEFDALGGFHIDLGIALAQTEHHGIGSSGLIHHLFGHELSEADEQDHRQPPGEQEIEPRGSFLNDLAPGGNTGIQQTLGEFGIGHHTGLIDGSAVLAGKEDQVFLGLNLCGADIPVLHHGDEGVVIHFMDLAFGQPGHEQEIEQHEQQKHQAIIIDEWSFGLLYFIHRYGPSRKELCYPNPSVQRPVTGKSTTWLSL